MLFKGQVVRDCYLGVDEHKACRQVAIWYNIVIPTTKHKGYHHEISIRYYPTKSHNTKDDHQ